MTIRILDTETTGIPGEILEIASVCINSKGIVSSITEDLVKPSKHEISFGAMATHHITPDMVEDKPDISEVIDKYKMESGYFIAHNAQFDLGMLPEGTIGTDVKIICTLKLARELFNKSRFGDHKLSTLWYGFGCYKMPFSYEGVPHRAGYDCFMTADVLLCMLEENELTIEKAYELIHPKPIEETLCFMKKYRDQKLTWKKVKEIDPDYCEWLVDNFIWNEVGKAIKKYLQS